MTRVVFFCLIIVGLINFLPLTGILSAQNLESAYGVELNTNELIILMRHRALLFGIIGSFVIYAAFYTFYQTIAMVMAGISMIGFVILAHLTGEYNANINNVITADYIGIAILAVAVGTRVYIHKSNKN
ncbi:hypothetical protein [Agaribacter marinus]|uniref:Phosphopantetheine adenylyltransferase n=1 Tax=Agaribacter marinus TaxID=1431249 RepID=A0AA37WJH2_9ALTE|nr:hypothetical protein [Agaribacter marinus]GLR72213.1 hypothetical protein GCM10007852_31210 [Agaribacter marinus]